MSTERYLPTSSLGHLAKRTIGSHVTWDPQAPRPFDSHPVAGFRTLAELQHLRAVSTSNDRPRKDNFMALEDFYRMAIHQTDQDLSEICNVDVETIIAKLRHACQQVAGQQNRSYKVVRDELDELRFQKGLIRKDDGSILNDSLSSLQKQQAENTKEPLIQGKTSTSARTCAGARAEKTPNTSQLKRRHVRESELKRQKSDIRYAQVQEAKSKFDAESGFMRPGTAKRFGWAPEKAHQYLYETAKLYTDEELREITRSTKAHQVRRLIKNACWNIANDHRPTYEKLLDDVDGIRLRKGLVSSRWFSRRTNGVENWKRKVEASRKNAGLRALINQKRKAVRPSTRELSKYRQSRFRAVNGVSLDSTILRFAIRQLPAPISQDRSAPNLCKSDMGKVCNHDGCRLHPQTNDLTKAMADRAAVRGLWGVEEPQEASNSTAQPEIPKGSSVFNPIQIGEDEASATSNVDKVADRTFDWTAYRPSEIKGPCMFIPGKRCYHHSCKKQQGSQ